MCVVWVRVLGMARVVLMDERVPASPGDEPAADRKGGCASEEQGDDEAALEDWVGQVGVHGAHNCSKL
jgi:hypothetical protein